MRNGHGPCGIIGIGIRRDIATSHEEADNVIAQQALMCAKQQSSTVEAPLSGDTVGKRKECPQVELSA